MLITRLSVTLQSFIWAGRGKEKKDEVLALSNKLMAQLSKESTVTIGQVLAARLFSMFMFYFSLFHF